MLGFVGAAKKKKVGQAVEAAQCQHERFNIFRAIGFWPRFGFAMQAGEFFSIIFFTVMGGWERDFGTFGGILDSRLQRNE